MLLGHYGVAFAAKKISPQANLAILTAAAVLIDLLWPIFLLVGLEKVSVEVGITKVTPLNFLYYPFSHSLLAVALWSFTFALIYFLYKKDKKSAVVIGALVLSHWFLDLLVHRPDLPLLSQNILFGFGLWNFPIITYALEFLFLFIGVFIYYPFIRKKNPWQKILFFCVVTLLCIIYLANIFGPPPPNVKVIAVAGNLQWLFIFLLFIIDNHYGTQNSN